MSEAIERPTVIAVGQRWKVMRSSEGHIAGDVVTIIDATFNAMKFENCGAHAHGQCYLLYESEFAHAAYLGPSSQGVRAGQRWKDDGGDDDVIIDSVDETGDCPVHFTWQKGHKGLKGAWERDMHGFALLPDTSPGEAETRERLLRELHEARARTVAVVENAATARIPATPCLRCGRMECICARREVSPDGKAWINYDRLTDGDSFEAYRFRRLDGVVVAMEEAPRVKIVGTYRGAAEMADGREKQAERTMIAIDSVRPKLLPSKPQAISQCHPTMWGGVWNLRGGR